MRFDSTAGRNWKSLFTAPNVLYRAPHIAPTTPWGGFGSAAADAMFAFGLRIGFDSTSARRDIVSGIGSGHWSVLQIVFTIVCSIVDTRRDYSRMWVAKNFELPRNVVENKWLQIDTLWLLLSCSVLSLYTKGY